MLGETFVCNLITFCIDFVKAFEKILAVQQHEQHHPWSIVSMTCLALNECRRCTWCGRCGVCPRIFADGVCRTANRHLQQEFRLCAEYDVRPFPHQQRIIIIVERRLRGLSTNSFRNSGVWPTVFRTSSSEKRKTATYIVYAMEQARTCQITCLHTSTMRNKNITKCATSFSFEMMATCVVYERDATGIPESSGSSPGLTGLTVPVILWMDCQGDVKNAHGTTSAAVFNRSKVGERFCPQFRYRCVLDNTDTCQS